MELTRLTSHIETTLAHTLSTHQHGIVDDEKNNSIVKTMVNYLQGLHDSHLIVNFALSVVNVSDDHISVSINITHLKGTQPFLIKSELRTHIQPQSGESDFDRAMRGV